MATLDPSAVDAALKELEGWTLEGTSIRRQFTMKSFAEAIAFVVQLAFEAEAADHHPDILVNFRRVTLTYTTHSEGGLTRKDIAGAQKADMLARP